MTEKITSNVQEVQTLAMSVPMNMENVMNVTDVKTKNMENNRQILFKAKRRDNGEWVTGYFAAIHIPIDFQNFGKGYEEHGYLYNDTNDRKNSFWYVINNRTLCQFTGFYAEDRVPIYENDIVECTYFDHNGYDTHVRGIVVWEDWGYSLKPIGDDKKKYEQIGYESLNLPIDTEDEIKVIRNKYDNSYDE